MGLYQECVYGLIAAKLRDRIAPDHWPIIDAGGAGHKDVIEDALDYAVETWDMAPGEDVDRVLDLEHCEGVADASVGTLICTSVLEHVRRPWLVAEQFARIVKPGGLVFVTAPWIFPIHKHPQDYWRFTLDSLGVLFGDAFERIDSGAFVAIPKQREGVWWLGQRRPR